MPFTLLQAEIRREFKRAQAYWVDVVADQIFFTLVFLLLSGLIHLLTEGNYTADTLTAALIGFVTWRVADGSILRTVDSLAEDARIGTLEQVALSPHSLGALLLARSGAILLYHTLRGLLLLGLILLVLGLRPHLHLGLLPIFLVTQGAAFGLAYTIAGLHLVTKNVSALTLALSTLLLFLTGAVTPLDNAPQLYALTRLLPLTAGIGLLRQLATQDLPLVALLTNPRLVELLLNTLAYGLLGWLVLTWGERTARRRGNLAHY